MRRVAIVLVAVALWSSGPAEAGLFAAVPPRSIPAAATAFVQSRPRTLDPYVLAQAKAQADAAAAVSRFAPTANPGPANGGVFDGQNSTGILGDGRDSPPDPTGAVGIFYPFNLPVPVRRTVQITNFGGSSSGLLHSGLNTARLRDIAGVRRTDCVFDPQLNWDQGWNRWVFVVAVQRSEVSGQCSDEVSTGITGDSLMVGISASSNPTWNSIDSTSQPWCTLEINTGSVVQDFPKLGHDNNFIIIGTNVYADYGSGDFVSSAIWAIRKSNPTPGHPCALWTTIQHFGGSASSVLRNSDGEATFTPVPAVTTDSSGAGYIVSAADPESGSATKLMLWHLSLEGGVAVLHRDGLIKVRGFQVPPNAPQPSTGSRSCDTAGDCLDSNDSRLTQAIARYDPDAHAEAIWTQHTVADPTINNLSMIRWYELIPGRSTPRQTGTVSDPNLYLFNAAISPSRAGNEAAIFYNASGPASGAYVSFRAQTRNRLTPLGKFQGEVVLAASHHGYIDDSCGISQDPPDTFPCRWGDYAGAVPDPLDANAVWGFGMYAADYWATQIAAVTPGCTTLQMDEAPAIGTRIMYTAHGVAGCDAPRYGFWLRDPDQKEILKRPFTSATTWTWETAGYAPGDYAVRAGATQSGDSLRSWEGASQWSGFTIPRCEVQSLRGDSQTSPVGSTISFAATSNPECDVPTYAYRYQAPGGRWVVARPYSSNSAWDFNTAGLKPGAYTVEVWEHRMGDSPATYENLMDTQVTLT